MVFRSSSWHRRYLQPRPHACAQISTPGTSRGGWGRCSYIRFQITSPPSDTSKNCPSAGWTWVTSSQGCSLVTSFTMGLPLAFPTLTPLVFPVRRSLGVIDHNLPPTVPISRKPSHPHPRLTRRQPPFAGIKNSPTYSRIPESPLFRLGFLPVRLTSDRPGPSVPIYLRLQL